MNNVHSVGRLVGWLTTVAVVLLTGCGPPSTSERFAAAVSFVPFVHIPTKWLTTDIPWEFYYVHYQEQWPWQQPGLLGRVVDPLDERPLEGDRTDKSQITVLVTHERRSTRITSADASFQVIPQGRSAQATRVRSRWFVIIKEVNLVGRNTVVVDD